MRKMGQTPKGETGRTMYLCDHKSYHEHTRTVLDTVEEYQFKGRFAESRRG